MKIKKIKALGILLSLALMLGLMPGMSFLTAKAAEESESFTTNTKQSVYTGSQFTISVDNKGDKNGFFMNSTVSGRYKAIIAARNGKIITKVELTRGYYSVEAVRATAGTVTYSGDVATVSGVNANSLTLYAEGKPVQIKQVVVYYTGPISVTGVTLNEYSTTLSVGETVSLKATIAPDNAADKTVKWSVSGDSVKLYSDSACTTEVGTGAVSALTVYAKGISAGDATVTVTTNDQDKTASCSVTVSKGNQTVTAPTAVSGLVYDGTAKTLVTAATVTTGNTASGSISYSLDNTSWSTSLPQGTNAGNYTVFYKVAGNNNYNEFVCSAPVSVTIAKSDPDAPTGLTAVVGQTLANVTLPDGWKWDDRATALTESGDKTFPAHFTETTNYKSMNADLTVTVADVSFNAVDGGSQTYNKSDLIFRFMMAGDEKNTYRYKETFKKATIKGPDIDRALNPGEYTATSGSLKLTLMNSFLETLKPGTYTVTVYFVDETEAHSASANFTVPSSGGTDIPKTDPSSGGTDIPETDENIMLIGAAMILVILSLSAIAYIMLRQRRYLTAKN